MISCTNLETGAYCEKEKPHNNHTVKIAWAFSPVFNRGKKRNLTINSESNPVDQNWVFVLMQVWIHRLNGGIQTGLSTKSPSGLMVFNTWSDWTEGE